MSWMMDANGEGTPPGRPPAPESVMNVLPEDGIANPGRYRVLKLMATGGMSRVYRAYDTRLRREVAVKVLPPALAHDPVRVERFRLEALRVSNLQHPNIVPLLDYGEGNGRFFLVMPFYPTALREVLQERGALPLSETVAIVRQVAAGLDYAHAHGLIHRDVKPENILLDGEGHALLTDFGISKAAPTAPEKLMTSGPLSAAEAGQMPIASIEYSAPEHLLGRQTDPRADVFALAVVTYETLTLRVPFPLDSERMYTTLMRMLTERPTPPSKLAAFPLPPETDAVILRALASEPSQRFESTGAFADALARLLAGTPEIFPTSPRLAPWTSGALPPRPAADVSQVWTQPVRPAPKRSRNPLRFLLRRRGRR